MTRHHRALGGFTLIELLTVIAIIGILASLVAAVLPRALERAKVGKAVATMKQIETALINYYTDYNSFPPGYGCLNDSAAGVDPTTLTAADFIYRPYMAYLDFHNNFDLYDNFADSSTDTDQDGDIDLLEFSPIGTPIGASGTAFVFNEIYNGTNLADEVNRQGETQRPFVYIPVSKRQVGRYADWLYARNAADPRPQASDATDPGNPLLQMQFPPPSYDAFVLISIGPDANTRRLLEPVGVGMLNPNYTYHVLGIMAYFMASRDANRNGQLDFEFRARSREGEAKVPGNGLPDPVAPNDVGPIILKSST